MAQPTTVAASNGITFALYHAAAQVVVRLRSSDGTFSPDELNAATLTLPGYMTGGTMDNGLFVPGTAQSTVEFAKNVGENNNSTIALIQPQTIAAGDELVRIVAGATNPRTYNVRYDQAVEFRAGVTTYLNIDIKKSAVTLSAQVLDWEDGQEIDFVLQAITVGGTLDGTDDFFQDQSIRIYKLGASPETSDYSYTLQNGAYAWSQGTIYWDDQDPATMNLGAAYTLGLQGLPQSMAANVTTFPWTVPVDQSGGYQEYDLLLSHLYLDTPTVAHFVFTHVLSKVRVELEAGTGFEESELTGATVRLNNMYLSGTADLNTAQVTATGTKTATITPYTQTAGKVYSALVMPQALSATDPIVTVTLSGYPGETFTGVLSAGLTLQAGKEHVIRVTLNKTGISLYATVEDWTTGDSGNVIID
ncbi:MAG: fimbrillin family protein [Bacteroides sp.]|nr:fimbrillin family protein [Bacteroides sp.]